MGFSADGELVWGIPIEAYDDDGEPTQFWNEDADDWIDFAEIRATEDGAVDPWVQVNGLSFASGDWEAWKLEHPEWVIAHDAWYATLAAVERTISIAIVTYGHHENPDGPRAILTSKRVPRLSGDCWTPTPIADFDLKVTDKVFSKAEDDARAFGLGVSFYERAKWWLVASYG